ncbi:hypothetical protein [Pseudalkalibacillus decolorationis]|uniref:hypothetical protein n=1 Tax=Pseudalkalibacillus decolorationis TaxID=163879 RepID=UPI002147D2A0|nr:hypothetical protein [Pseudalkalibacillus decolorationis]
MNKQGGENSKDPEELSAEELPKVDAFQDEFTRKFMDSTEEVKEGYYKFRSGTNGYTMLFPEDGKLSEKSYSIEEKRFENIDFGAGMGQNISYFVIAKYYQSGTSKENTLSLIRGMQDYEGDFKEVRLSNKTIYFASSMTEFEDEKDTFYNYFSFIKSNESEQGIVYNFSIGCSDVEKPCDIDLKKSEETAKMMMKSVKFTKGDEKEGE